MTVKTKLDVYSFFHMSDSSNDLYTTRNREIFKCLQIRCQPSEVMLSIEEAGSWNEIPQGKFDYFFFE